VYLFDLTAGNHQHIKIQNISIAPNDFFAYIYSRFAPDLDAFCSVVFMLSIVVEIRIVQHAQPAVSGIFHGQEHRGASLLLHQG
jgi:hypothetical protein